MVLDMNYMTIHFDYNQDNFGNHIHIVHYLLHMDQHIFDIFYYYQIDNLNNLIQYNFQQLIFVHMLLHQFDFEEDILVSNQHKYHLKYKQHNQLQYYYNCLEYNIRMLNRMIVGIVSRRDLMPMVHILHNQKYYMYYYNIAHYIITFLAYIECITPSSYSNYINNFHSYIQMNN